MQLHNSGNKVKDQHVVMKSLVFLLIDEINDSYMKNKKSMLALKTIKINLSQLKKSKVNEAGAKYVAWYSRSLSFYLKFNS